MCVCVCVWGYTYISHGVHMCMCVLWGALLPQCSCGGPRNTASVLPHLLPCFRLCLFFRCWLGLLETSYLINFCGSSCSCLTPCVGTWGRQLCMTCQAICECSGLESTSSHLHGTVFLVPWSLHLFRGFTQFTFYDFWECEKVYTVWRVCNFWGLYLLFKKIISIIWT